MFLFTVDSAGGSAGMMIGEVADLLIRDYGVYNALSTDGGGSVSLAMEDPVTHVRSLVNSQSNGAFAREVASSLAVFASSMTNVTHTVNTSPAGLGFSVDGSAFTSGQTPPGLMEAATRLRLRLRRPVLPERGTRSPAGPIAARFRIP